MEKYILYYNNFIDILLTIFADDTTKNSLYEIKSLPDNIKLNYGNNFNDSITNTNFRNFLESKIKLVSHKNNDTLVISQSLFGYKLCLKNILNNQTTEIKKIIWFNLHTLYLNIELLKPNDKQNNNQILQLQKLLDNNDNNNTYDNNNNTHDNNNDTTVKSIQQLLNVDVNNETNDMLDDIVGSFQDILSGQNPMNGILNVSQQISQKYADKINNGDIELDKLMESIVQKVPGIGEMMKNIPINQKSHNTQQESQYVMDENFSTASVPLGIDNNPLTNNMNLGNMLKMADGMGFIPNLTTSNNTNIESNNIPGMENLHTLFGFVNKLENTKDPDNIDNVKNEMDSFLQNNLGIDINKFNDDIKKLM